MNIWFGEPSEPDPTFGRRGESTVQWLSRSTAPRAKEARRFLNQNLSKLPEDIQESFVSSLSHRWQSAFFELIVARVLQELGATIRVEVANPDGRRPDFIAAFEDGTVSVEASVPLINPETGEELKRRIPLLDAIEARIPKGWNIAVWQLPYIGPSGSRKEFVQVIERVLAIPPPEADADVIDLIEELSTGVIHLQLRPSHTGRSILLTEPPVALIDDTESRLRSIVAAKKRQVKNSPYPVLLAVQASGISSDFEDFDRALYGHTFDSFDENMRLREIGFRPDGVFNNNRPEPPTYAGVIAFLNVGFRKVTPPRLYHHPRFGEDLPEALSNFEQCLYEAENERICIKPADSGRYLENLDLVADSV